jgi:hypothetical protein
MMIKELTLRVACAVYRKKWRQGQRQDCTVLYYCWRIAILRIGIVVALLSEGHEGSHHQGENTR